MKKVHRSSFIVHRKKSVSCRHKHGFTLVELIIYMGLLAIFLMVLTDIFVSILSIRTQSEATSSIEQDGRFILARLNYDINRATNIKDPKNLGQTKNKLKMDIAGVTYEYSVKGGNLRIKNDLGTENLNSSESTISNTTFQRIGNIDGKDTIKIQFIISSIATRPSGPETRTFQTTVGLR